MAKKKAAAKAKRKPAEKPVIVFQCAQPGCTERAVVKANGVPSCRDHMFDVCGQSLYVTFSPIHGAPGANEAMGSIVANMGGVRM